MQYQLEIYRSGHFGDGGCIKSFSSTDPFMLVRVGDLLDSRTWGEAACGSNFLRVLNVEHCISEKTSPGIDPSGAILHRVLIYTERAIKDA
jgi:hypothetical protein